MRDTLVLQLPSRPDAPVSWTLRSTPGEGAARTASTQQDTLEDLLPRLHDKRVIVLVPTECVFLTHVEIATRQSAKLLQAVPYALEEQLAADVDDLHFALGARDGNVTPVAVVSDAQMAAWLQPLTDAGIQPDVVMPDVLALPQANDADATVLIDTDGRALVRTGLNSGFACPVTLLPSLLNKASAEPLGLHTMVVAGAQVPDALGLAPNASSPADALAAMTSVPAGGRLNLLQGAYAPRRSFDAWLAAARWPAALAATWLILSSANLALQNHRLSSEYNALADDTLSEFQQAFPDQTRIVDIRAQTEQALRRLQGGAQDQGFLSLLARSSTALAKVGALQLQSAQYREGSLYLNLTGTDLQALDTLRSHFDGLPELALEVQSANKGSEGVQVRLKVDAQS